MIVVDGVFWFVEFWFIISYVLFLDCLYVLIKEVCGGFFVNEIV